MNPPVRAAASRGVVLLLVALTLAAAAIRVRLVPGLWNADALYYGSLLAGDHPPAGLSNRDYRWMLLALARGGSRLAGSLPVGASLPSLVFGVAAVPLTWLAARRALGAAVALLPAAVVALVPVAIDESSRISADGPLAAFGAALLCLLLRIDEEDAGLRRGELLALGLVSGAGFVFKETFALVAGPAFAWLAWTTWRGRLPWRGFAVAALPAVALVAADQLLSTRLGYAGGRLGLVDVKMAAQFHVDEGAARRMEFGPLLSLETDAARWGGLFLVAAPAIAIALSSRALRSPVAWLALGGVLGVWCLPISLRAYAVLPADQPRYLLGSLPALATLPFLALAGPPPGRMRSVVAALVGAVALWPARHELALAAAVLVALAATLAPERFRGVAPLALGTALVASLVPRGGPWCEAARWTLLVPAAVAAVAPTRATWTAVAAMAAIAAAMIAADAVREPTREAVAAQWSLADRLVGARRVFATRFYARVLRVASPGSSVLPWDDDLSAAGRLPPGAAPGDVCVCGVEDAGIESRDADAIVERHGAAWIVRLKRQ